MTIYCKSPAFGRLESVSESQVPRNRFVLPGFSTSISAKLFLAVLFTAACVVIAMALAAQWSFNRGFLGYLNEQEAERLDAARPRIVQAYLDNSESWEFLRGDRRR